MKAFGGACKWTLPAAQWGRATLGGLNLQVGSDARQTLQDASMRGCGPESRGGNANTTLFFITFNNVIMCDMNMEVNPWHVNERDFKSDLHLNMTRYNNDNHMSRSCFGFLRLCAIVNGRVRSYESCHYILS